MTSYLYIYNPTCDMAVENGTLSYMPPALLRKFEEDISPLMSLLTSDDDILITTNKEWQKFAAFWKQAGFSQPSYLNWEQIKQIPHNYKIFPWGWSRIIAHRLKQFNPEYDFTQPETKQLFSRQTSLDILTELEKNVMALHEIIDVPSIPSKIENNDQLENMLNQYPNGIIVKTLYSSSGRGLLFIKSKDEIDRNKSWIEAKIRAHGYIIAEPLYNKVQDASLQFIIEDEHYHFLGLNFFDSDEKGKFQKEYIGTPDKIQQLLPKDNNWVQQAAEAVIMAMKAIGLHKKYSGPVGVDTIFFTDNEQQLKYHPIIEANLRCNMGLINMKLKERIHSNSIGTWQIETFKPGKAQIFFTQQMSEHPIRVKDGKISEGFIPLSSYGTNQQFAAWGMIQPNQY